jgi:hypothetical protein
MKKDYRNSFVFLSFVLLAGVIVLTAMCSVLSGQIIKAQRGDINLDGKVDISDLSILSNNWQK